MRSWRSKCNRPLYAFTASKQRRTAFNLEEITDEVAESIENIIQTAAWIHHTITHIHPFREGNGRTARLAANLILERHGLVGISIRIEKENKNEAPRAYARGIKAEFSVANPPSHKASEGSPCAFIHGLTPMVFGEGE